MFKDLEGAPKSIGAIGAAFVLIASLSACQSVGPNRGAVSKAAEQATIPGLRVIEVNDAVAAQTGARAADAKEVFARDFSGATPIGTTVGVGDTLEVTIWEASPPALFGTTNLDPGTGASIAVSQANTLPGFQVGPSGTITVPFAGQVPAAGRTVHQIEQDIVRRLQGRAHLPQAIVRIARNVTSTVTVLGDVKQPTQVPLTPHGERVLDALSAAGGTAEPLDRMTVQLTRGDMVRRMAASDIVSDPRNNVILASGDVVTALFQPYSFTVLGAAGKNEEVRFEGTGITLSQALGRVGGLQNDRADPKGVFIFRWERPEMAGGAPAAAESDGAATVPVIYRVDMKQPETYLAAQKFRMRDGDVLYVSNSPVADLQRFVNIVASSILPFSTVRNIAR